MALNLAPAGTYLLETSAVIMTLRRGASAARGTMVPFATLGELLIGVHRAVDYAKEPDLLLAAAGKAHVIYPTVQTVGLYAQIAAVLRQLGQIIPTNDLWIAAIALELDLPLLTDDAHFTRVPGLKVLQVR